MITITFSSLSTVTKYRDTVLLLNNQSEYISKGGYFTLFVSFTQNRGTVAESHVTLEKYSDF